MVNNCTSDEDDYMSDVYLNVNVNIDKCKSAKLLRQIEIDKKRIIANELNKQKQKKIYETFEKKIDSSNIGFKMLQKMGYKEGKGLGIDDREGIGLKQEKIEKFKCIKRLKETNEKITKESFLKKVKYDNNYDQILKDIHTARRICQHLDENNKITSPKFEFWPISEDFENFENPENSKTSEKFEINQDLNNPSFISKDIKKVKPVNNKSVSNENLLNEMLNYLRSIHLYCIYCGTCFDNEKDLEKNCPGKYYDDH